MKRIALLAVIAAGLLALPGTASATISDCNYQKPPPPQTQTVSLSPASPGTVTIWVDPAGGRGVTGDGYVGVCADEVHDTAGGPDDFDGGYVEVGKGAGDVDNGYDSTTGDDNKDDNEGVYAVVDGSDENTGGAGQATGYGAVSNYETYPNGGSPDPDDDAGDPGTPPLCDGDDEDDAAGGHDGPDSNSGGCVYSKNADVGVQVPLIACGETSGRQYTVSSRDGCSI